MIIAKKIIWIFLVFYSFHDGKYFLFNPSNILIAVHVAAFAELSFETSTSYNLEISVLAYLHKVLDHKYIVRLIYTSNKGY